LTPLAANGIFARAFSECSHTIGAPDARTQWKGTVKSMLSIAILLLLAVILACPASLNAATRPADDARARQFIAGHESRIRPLEKELSLAWWTANVSGKDEDFKAKEQAQNKLDEALADKATFSELKALKQLKLRDPLIARQIEVLYLMYLEKQVPAELLKKMTSKANTIEQAFNVFRARVDNKEMTDSEVRKLLKASKDSARRKAVWEASKAVGAAVEKDLLELVGLRNEAARALGFKDYHVLQLYLNEQTQEQVLSLFDQLDALTREPFRRAKADIDASLARNCGISVGDLRPWHYHDPFFQEPPAVYDTDLDAVYAGVDILKLCKDYYAGIGLPIDDVIARSDLYEKPGKSPHAFCTDIDREGDVRVLANIVPNEYWMNTMLHELGHSVYSSKNIPRTLPYVLRTEAHILTTEGVAMLFERPAKSADWLQKMGVTVPDPKGFNETGERMLRDQLLIFSRWCQVMLRFEKELYSNPNQDLSKLWWDLVEKHQFTSSLPLLTTTTP
jgi:peptidyl-dipeptidase A